jgi:hypothetical protein
LPVSLSEPTTLITDYLLAVFSTVFGVVLFRARTHRATLLWSIGFLSLAVAGLTGGSFHGFRLMMSDSAHRSLWNITCLLIGASAGFMISGALTGPLSRYGTNTRWHAGGLAVSIAGLVIQQGHFSPHPSFNHNDLFHCVQIAALFCFFRGARMTA